jgi:hypothetical protein
MNITKRLLLCVALLLGFATSAHAEDGCMAGFRPVRVPIQGIGDCAPIPDYNSGDSQPAASVPVARWLSKWGALAIDSAEGTYGAAVNASSKRKAEKEALSLCKKGGGKSCKVLGWMSNQCQALAWGDKGPYGTTANTLEAATKKAHDMCSSSAGNCKIYHSSCSYAVRVR